MFIIVAQQQSAQMTCRLNRWTKPRRDDSNIEVGPYLAVDNVKYSPGVANAPVAIPHGIPKMESCSGASGVVHAGKR